MVASQVGQAFQLAGRIWTTGERDYRTITSKSNWGDLVIITMEEAPTINGYALPTALWAIEEFDGFFEALLANGPVLELFRSRLIHPALRGGPLGDHLQLRVEEFRRRWIDHERSDMRILGGSASASRSEEERLRRVRVIAYDRVTAILQGVNDSQRSSIMNTLRASWLAEGGDPGNDGENEPTLTDLLITTVDRSRLDELITVDQQPVDDDEVPFED